MTSATIIRKFNALHNKQVSKPAVEKLLSEVNAFIKTKRIDSHGPEGEKVLNIRERLSKLLPKVNGQEFKLRIEPKVNVHTPSTVVKKIKKLSGKPEIEAIIYDMIDRKVYSRTWTIKSEDGYTAFINDVKPFIDDKKLTVKRDGKKFTVKLGPESLKKISNKKSKRKSFKHKSRGKLSGKKPYKGATVFLTKKKGKIIIKRSTKKEDKKQLEKLMDAAYHDKLKTGHTDPIVTKRIKQISKNLSGVQYNYREIDLGDFKKDFHKMFSDTIVQIHGLPGHGKTVYVLKIAQDRASRTGDHVLYVAHEEFGRSTLDLKLKEQNIGHKNLRIRGSLTDADAAWATVIILDSVNSLDLTSKGVKQLTEKFPNKNWILILQSTKDGKFRGDQTWEHLVDIAGEVRDRKLILSKNRLDPDNKDKAAKLRMDALVNEKTQAARIREKVKYEATKDKVL